MYRRMVHRRYRGKRYAVLFLALAMVCGLTWLAYRHHREFYSFFLRRRAFDPLIEAAARRHGLDPLLVKAVVWQESRFKPNVTGRSGEIGLMQVLVEKGAVAQWASDHGRPLPPRSVLYHPSFNLEIGAWYLARAMRRWRGYEGQMALALAEYNAGVSGVNWKEIDPDPYMSWEAVAAMIAIPSTQEYVRSVIGQYHEYCQRREAQP